MASGGERDGHVASPRDVDSEDVRDASAGRDALEPLGDC